MEDIFFCDFIDNDVDGNDSGNKKVIFFFFIGRKELCGLILYCGGFWIVVDFELWRYY